MKVKKKKSGKKTRFYLFIKWGLFVPTFISGIIYILAFLIELLTFKKLTEQHTSKDVKNARMWFIYCSLPFFNENHLFDLWYKMDYLESRLMVQIYKKRSFNKTLKMFVPFARSYNALEAYNLKTGNTLEFVDD